MNKLIEIYEDCKVCGASMGEACFTTLSGGRGGSFYVTKFRKIPHKKRKLGLIHTEDTFGEDTNAHVKDGLLHSETHPAMTGGGVECWFKNGVYHREGGPAYVETNERRTHWCINGNLHRIDGPALIERNFDTGVDEIEWYIKGIAYRNCTKFMKAAGFSKEESLMFVLRYGKMLPNVIKDGNMIYESNGN